MALLKVSIMTVSIVLVSPAAANPVDRWQSHIGEASVRFGIPEDWIKRVIRAESGGRTMKDGAPIRSRVGAMGLMQIMPGTWAYLRIRHRLGNNPDDPRDNILGGTAYLREMYNRFGYPGLFGAYNAGPQRYASYLRGKSRLPAETIGYLAAVTARNNASGTRPLPRKQIAAGDVPPPAMFFTNRPPTEMKQLPQPVTGSGLFMPLFESKAEKP